MTFVILLALLGLLLIFFEFFIPSGVLGALAAGLLIGSTVAFGFLGWGWSWTLLYMGLLLVLGVVICWIALARVRQKLSLKTDQEGFQASSMEGNYKGKTGVVFTDLRPTGHILIDGKQLQALSETGYLPKESRVVVTGGRGAYLIVKKKDHL